MRFNWEDTSALSYQYHAFGIEQLSNELRFLIDSNVVLRLPERLIPPGNRQYDFLHVLDRSPVKLFLGEFGMDSNDSTKYLAWKSDFEQYAAHNWAGCWPDAHGHPAGHKRIDYVRVWDVPADCKISDFPR